MDMNSSVNPAESVSSSAVPATQAESDSSSKAPVTKSKSDSSSEVPTTQDESVSRAEVLATQSESVPTLEVTATQPEYVSATAVLAIQSETVTFHREPPPPYDSLDGVVRNQPIVQTIIVQPTLKNVPMYYVCHKCEQRVLTIVKYESTKKTHMLAGFVFGFTLWCSLCCLAAIPYLMKTFKKAHHYCPNCDSYLGAYSKM